MTTHNDEKRSAAGASIAAKPGDVALAYLERLDCDMRDGQFVARSVVRDEALTDLRALLARAEAAERSLKHVEDQLAATWAERDNAKATVERFVGERSILRKQARALADACEDAANVLLYGSSESMRYAAGERVRAALAAYRGGK